MENIEVLIKNYRPTEEAIDLVRQIKIVLMVGITGAGKDTIKRELISRFGYNPILSCTTREPRMNGGRLEKDGVDYHFFTVDEAKRMIIDKKFVETKLVHGNTIVGTLIDEIKKVHEKNGIAINDIDVQGVQDFVDLSDNVIPIFIMPPSYEVWIERLMNRYENKAEFDAAWQKRRSSAINELSVALSKPYYRFVINDDLEEAIDFTKKIIDRNGAEHAEDAGCRFIAKRILQMVKSS